MVVPSSDLNRNTEWFTYPRVWTTYISLLFFPWYALVSVTNSSADMAWTIVNLAHFAVTYHFFHWKKGTPFGDDQGIYNRLTWWEHLENGKQLTRNRKFLTLMKHLVLGAIVMKALGSFLFIVGNNLGVVIPLLHQAITAPTLFHFYNYGADNKKGEYAQQLIKFTQSLALFGTLLFFHSMKELNSLKIAKEKYF